MSQATKLKEYSERHRFWADQAVKQTTFSNNILLTISIAVFGYFFVNRGVVYKSLTIDFSLPINHSVTFFVIGTSLVSISIMLGLFLSFTRLYDFRLTRHILLTRKRAMDKCYLLPGNDLPEENFCQSIIGFFCIIFRFDKFKIKKNEFKTKKYSAEDCKGPPFNLRPSKSVRKKFNYLRMRSDSFGKLTHRLLICQLLFFALGLFSYAIVMIIKDL